MRLTGPGSSESSAFEMTRKTEEVGEEGRKGRGHPKEERESRHVEGAGYTMCFYKLTMTLFATKSW